MIKAKFGDRIDGWIHRLLPFLFRREVNPNALTLFGTVISLCAAAMFAVGAFQTGAIVLLIGGFFDLVDGVVARHFGRSTAFGAFLDSTMDRLVDMVVLFGIIVHYAVLGHVGTLMLAGVVLIGSVMTSYAKARAELCIPELSGGIFERGERIGLLAAGGLFTLMVPVLWILAIGSTYTVFQRFAVARREMMSFELATADASQRDSSVQRGASEPS